MTSDQTGTAPIPASANGDRPLRPVVAGIIVAAGRGTRYGAPDKVLLPLAGRPLLGWVLAAFDNSLVREIVVVVGGHTRAMVESLVEDLCLATPVRMVGGGERRQDSVAFGVKAVGADIDLVAIHDAARPLISAALIDRTIERAVVTGAAIAASPVTDTLKRVGDDFAIRETVPRDGLWAAQTPQVFNRELLARVSEGAFFRDTMFTDEAALFEALGHSVSIVPNHEPNPKVTHPGDLRTIAALLDTPDDARERHP